ncbi:MAG: imidazolonepropionase [Acidobacteriota bacterium]|nr:imidazolonepropionase [Acidobacteriota bacterium]
MKVDLIIENAAQLVTCFSGGKPKRGKAMADVGIIENGALAIADGKIIAVGEAGEIKKNFQSENRIDASRKVVCPAFVDPHTHIVFAGNRLNEFELKIKGADYLEILETGGGILSTVRQTRAASLESLIEQTRPRLDAMLACGTLTAEVKTGYGLSTESELKMLEAIFALDKIHPIDLIPTFLPAHTFPSEFKGKEDAYVDLICDEMLPEAKSVISYQLSVVSYFVDVFCEQNAFNLVQSRRVLETAKKLGFGLKAHVDEFNNLGGAKLAIELGATSIDHLDATSDEEIALLAKSNTIGIVTPTVNFNFGSTHFADARKMIDANCAIAVSTDYNPGSAPCPSPPLAMAIACRYQKLLPSEAFNAATINAAFAIGSGEKTGSLEVGKQADVLILDTTYYRQIAYEFGANFVETIIKSGKIIAR